MKRISLLAIFVLVGVLILAGCQEQIFDGSVTGNETQFILDFNVLNTTKTHEMKLEEGTNIYVSIEKKSGNIAISITDSDGKVIYKSDSADSWDFVVTTTKVDTYKFTVTGTDAKGSVSFKTIEE